MNGLTLRGRTALVTGGASGMGRAIALALARAGADVAIGSRLSSASPVGAGELVFLPSHEEMRSVEAELGALGVRALALPLDVCSSASARDLVATTVAQLGPIDILVNAAGMTVEQAVCDHPEALWQKVLDVNLSGVFRMTQLCLPAMIARRWGRIINIASTAASVGAPTSAAYSASKAGVVGLTRCVALEGAPHRVTCNAISPGWVDTRFGAQWMAHIAEHQMRVQATEYREQTRRSNPQQRLIQPEEIAGMAVYLCQETALGVTGQDLTIAAGSLW